MKCKYCGQENQAGAKFCTGCGKMFEVSTDAGISTDAGTKRKITKKDILSVCQTLIALLICGIMIFLMVAPFGVSVKTGWDSGSEEFSLWQTIMYLINGGNGYNATVLSIIIGFSALLFTVTTPLFHIGTIFPIYLKKSERGIRRIAVIMTAITLVLQCAMLPLACKLVPYFKAIYAKEINYMVSDISGIISWWIIGSAVLVTVLMILGAVVTCKKNEEKGIEE